MSVATGTAETARGVGLRLGKGSIETAFLPV